MMGSIRRGTVQSNYARSVFLRYVDEHPASAQYASFPMFMRDELGITDGHAYLRKMLHRGLLKRGEDSIVLTDAGRSAIDQDDLRHFDLANPYVTIFEYRAAQQKLGDGASFEKIMQTILLRKLPQMKEKDDFCAVEHIALDAAVLFKQDGQAQQAMKYYLIALYYETCGLEYYEKLVRLVHSKCKPESVKNDYRGICIQPEVVEGMHQLRDAFDPKMVDNIFQTEQIAINMVTRKDFTELARSLCDGSYDYNAWNAKYGKAFAHVLDQAKIFKGELK